MRHSLYRTGVALLTFIIGIAVVAGWYALRRTRERAGGLLTPKVEEQQAEYGTLRWHVQQAKAEGKREYVTASIGCGMGVQSLNYSLANYSLVLVEPIEKRTYADTDHLITWYKFRVIETFSVKPPHELHGKWFAEAKIPADLGTPGADEIVMATSGGTMVIDEVTVKAYYNAPRFKLSEKYLLFLELDSDKRIGSIPWTDQVGIFTVKDDDLIASAYDDGSYDLKDKLATRFGNSLARLRESLVRRSSKERGTR